MRTKVAAVCIVCEAKRAEARAEEREAIRAETARLHDLSSYGLREVLEDLLAFIRARGEAPKCSGCGAEPGSNVDCTRCMLPWSAPKCATCADAGWVADLSTRSGTLPCPDCAPKPDAQAKPS